MDWATQPDPFRRHEGAVLTLLPRTRGPGADQTYDSLFGPPPAAVSVTESVLGAFFYLSLALSAWKEVVSPAGEVVSRWPLRVNPSSGNLHPTEAWLASADGVFHYRPDVHALERVATWPGSAWSATVADLPAGTMIIGLTSILWREAWKYGERAFRYCQHDAGHAMAALGLAAAPLGWTVAPLHGAGASEMAAFLGITDRDGPEAEHPDLLFALCPGPGPDRAASLSLPRAEKCDTPPNALSPSHVEWDLITEVAEAVKVPPASAVTIAPPPRPAATAALMPDRALNAAELIRGRRSAVAMDGATHLDRDAFYRLLTRLLPTARHPAFALFRARTAVSLLLMVHRVTDVAPGLYALVRQPDHLSDLKQDLRATWRWETPPGCPPDLPLYFLGPGDLRAAAGRICCGQDIAAAGAFSVAMLARFAATLEQAGPSAYPELFRETGAIGQVLYLEAEAAGVSGTGIGCYFDDEMHRMLGVSGHSWQSLYHFTVGGALVDDRLRTAPPYGA
jgi:SagB-type dehydrogenase family enzyme